ncbi:hypothetical protein PYW07_012633 [Mythimna separata]|uniref:ZAD domain-containing protein n=1 Tax=Mythimna separata TaxID=271217 RepID=A0AAD7Y8H4_MYTSE|nr:hypothetical protein PYW07_012633 [Mythimna separata]
MEKLSMCRICLVENVRMCVVTDKSLQETYEKLTDVPFVTEDRKPMLACSFCCTRLKQCCQLQRKCVEAEELLAQMLSEDYEQKPLTIENLGFVSSFITSPVTHISIGADCQIGSDAIKQELPAVCEEQDDVELQLTHLSEGKALWQSSRDYFENLCNSHPDVEAHHSESEAGEDKFTVVIKMEEEHELSENRTDREIKKPELQNPDKSSPGIKDIPDHDSGSDSEDDVPLIVMKTEAEEGQEVSNKKRGACESQRADVAKSWSE